MKVALNDEINETPEATKMLGGLVPESVFWAFKAMASKRKESMQAAILHAAWLYMCIGEPEGGSKDDKQCTK